MENKKLSADQLNKLKEIVRQRFDELYHRIGTNRQSLSTKVLMVDQSINKELAKETIDTAHEMEILRKIREVERVANAQLPLFHKVTSGQAPTAQKTESSSKPVEVMKESKPAKEIKPAKATKESKPAKAAKDSKPAKTAKVSKPAKAKKKKK